MTRAGEHNDNDIIIMIIKITILAVFYPFIIFQASF